MIDWLAASVPFEWERPINDGQFLKIKPDGEVDWCVDRRKVLEGSYSSKITVRTVKRGFIEVSGNPAKFLQGHNLFGTDDVPHLTALFMDRISTMLNLPQPEFIRKAWRDGHFDISRIDINYMFPLRDRSEVRAWLRAAQETTRVKWRGRGQSEDGTLYFGKAQKGGRAKPWMMKLYCKADEMKLNDVPLNADDWHASPEDGREFDGGTLPHSIPYRKQLAAWADNKLRVELTLRTQELKRMGLQSGSMLSPNVVRETFAVYLSKLEIGEAVMVAVSDVENLPRALRRTYNEWKTGVDLRQELPKATFFRQRKAIMDALGVDIGVLQPKTATVIPLRRAIVLGEAAPVPSWAPDTICVRAA